MTHGDDQAPRAPWPALTTTFTQIPEAALQMLLYGDVLVTAEELVHPGIPGGKPCTPVPCPGNPVPPLSPVAAALTRQHCREIMARLLAPSYGVRLPTRTRLPACDVCRHRHVGPCSEFDAPAGEPCPCDTWRADPWQHLVWKHFTGFQR